MMEVGRTFAAPMAQSTANTERKRDTISMEDFLKIMAAEMRNQNPMGGEGGGSKTDYITQMAQITSLEQVTRITEGVNYLTLMGQQQYSFSLIGKEVTLIDGEETVTGIVDKVRFQNGIIGVQVNDVYYYIGSIIEVGEKEVEK